jgi:hypothetical protein
VIATYVDPQYTSLSWQKAAEIIRWALSTVMTERPRDDVVALVMAKTALESGRWGLRRGAMKNWNVGNIKAGPAYQGMFTCFACDEILQGRGRVWFEPDGREKDSKGWTQPIAFPLPPGHPQTRFRAYAGAHDGFSQYVDFLAANKRYARAWQALLSGDPAAYVHALKVSGYFTADEAVYRSAVVSLFREFVGKLKGLPEPDLELEDEDWDRLRAMVVSVQFDTLGIVREEALDELREKHDTEPAPPPDEGGGDV